jgi:hypothetical protein
MAATQAQRAALFNTLTELMGQHDAETLTEQLPPTGWESMATKDDVKALGAVTNANIADRLAHAAEQRAQALAAIADANNRIAEANIKMAEGLAHAAEERAKALAAVARNLYVTVATIVLATVSIWIAVLVAPAA